MPIKEATFWWGTIVGGTGIYFWVQGGDRMTAGIILTFFGVLMSAYAVFAHHYPATLPRLKMWVFALVLTWAALGYDIYDRHHPFPWDEPEKYLNDLQLVRLKTFTNESVELDGKHFEHCHFVNVTFIYRGSKPFLMEDSATDFSDRIELKIAAGPQYDAAILAQAMITGACRARNLNCDYVRIDHAK